MADVEVNTGEAETGAEMQEATSCTRHRQNTAPRIQTKGQVHQGPR